MLGDWHARQGLRQEAASYYLKTLELDPADTEAANNLGACLADGGHRAQALALLCKVVELNPGNAGAWANLGVATSNSLDEPTFPNGLDVEVMRFECLERAWMEARLPSEREHVTPYLYNCSGRFRLGSYCGEPDLSNLRWTVDEPEDLELVRRIYEAL